MKNNTYNPRLCAAMLSLLFWFTASAQTPYTVVKTGLNHPTGLDVDASNRLWLTQTGTGINDASVSILKPDGTLLPVLKNLPSNIGLDGIEGSWHTAILPSNQLAVIQGGGTDRYTGTVLFFNTFGFIPGTTPAMTPAMNNRELSVTPFITASGFTNSNPYSLATDASNNIYVSDAGANSIIKYSPSSNVGRIITTLPSIRNPIPVGPPVVDQVPTRIIARPNGGFYIATLTGFPFNSGAATIYRMTEAGVVTPYKTGLTMLTDLAVDESTGDLYALQFARFSLQIFNTLPNSSTITRIKPNGTTEVVAEGFGPSSGMALDKDGNIFVTEIFSGRVLKFSGLVTRNISFSVDMSNQRISSRGVYMAHDLNGWKPNAVRMTDMGNNIYKATVSVPQSTPLRYKFMNGDTWGTNEDVPIGCGMTNAQGGVDRVFRATTVDSFSVGTVCFSSCIQCGNTRPQTSFFYCPRDPNLIVCDNFESYQYDKLVPQASHWTTLGLALDGTTLSNTRDNPNVAGFWNGYANYDGTRAMRVRSDFYNNVADEPMLYLGNPREGRYEMSFKIYISKNKSAVISFMDTTDVSNVWHFTLDFSKGNLYILETLDIGTELPSTPVAYRSNDWNDVSIVFNAATKKMTVKLNNSSVFNAVVASQGSFPFLDFNTYDAISGYTNESEYFIDDLVYRRIANTESLLPQTGANTSAYRSISPNPANETMVFATDDQTKGDWQVRLINTVGQVVFQKNGTDAQSIDISTAAYKTGIYVVEFKSDSEHWTQKVVIQH